MRIIGGNDYYDSAAAYGIDPGIVFVRHPFDLTKGDMNRLGRYSTPSFYLREKVAETNWAGEQAYRMGTIGKKKVGVSVPYLFFCGKVYTGIVVQVEEDRFSLNSKVTTYRFWKPEKFEAFLEENNWEVKAESWHFGEYQTTSLGGQFKIHTLEGDAFQCLLEKQITIATLTNNYPNRYNKQGRVLNNLDDPSDWAANGDTLKELEFQKAIDPVTAFQEIAQWVGGTLASYGPNTVEITDDNVKIAKHGMDKWSFRKKTDKSK